MQQLLAMKPAIIAIAARIRSDIKSDIYGYFVAEAMVIDHAPSAHTAAQSPRPLSIIDDGCISPQLSAAGMFSDASMALISSATQFALRFFFIVFVFFLSFFFVVLLGGGMGREGRHALNHAMHHRVHRAIKHARIRARIRWRTR